MNLSYNWLKQYVDLKGISHEKLAEELTLAGLEVEQITYLANASNLVIGKVLEISAHPDADTLKVAQVDLGDEVAQIVCGAPNVDKGQKVIVAKVGANVNGLKIKAASIRGVESNGMICSLNELGVAESSLSEEQMAGIEVLSDDAVIGNTNVLEYLKLDDAIIEVDLTPNRSDAYAMYNLAHEVGALLERKVTIPKIHDHSVGLKSDLIVKSEAEESLRVVGKIINKVKVKPSVPWMVDVLRANNMQPINNIVDISNIVMLETGQPLHFYDTSKLPALELIVKNGYSEKYTALDEVEYEIKPEDLVITSNDQIIGIAGIMGGEDSKISDDTTSILIEAAHFDLARIRISSRNLNISSEASSRFSKGIDPNAIFYATNRAVDLLIEYADANDIEETVIFGESEIKEKRIVTTSEYINSRLGINLSNREVMNIFERLNFNPVEIDNTIVTYIPTYRLDIVSEVDLSEEVIRLYGVDSLPATLPFTRMIPAKKDDRYNTKQAIIMSLLGNGFNETISYSLISDKQLAHSVMPIGEPVELSNPISNDKKYYRTSLFASMLDVIAYNEARNNSEFSLYEIANVYSNDNESQERLVIAQSIKHSKSIWENLVNIESFFSLKGKTEAILNKVGITSNRIKLKANEIDQNNFHPHQSAEVYVDNKLVGVIGEVHPKVAKEYDISPILIAEFNLEILYAAKKAKVKFTPIPIYPSISRDIALIVEDSLLSENLINTIIKAGRPLVTNAEVFDVYQGDNIEENKKSVAIRINYQAMDRTLTDEDVNEVHNSIVEALIKAYNVEYRK